MQYCVLLLLLFYQHGHFFSPNTLQCAVSKCSMINLSGTSLLEKKKKRCILFQSLQITNSSLAGVVFVLNSPLHSEIRSGFCLHRSCPRHHNHCVSYVQLFSCAQVHCFPAASHHLWSLHSFFPIPW